jgi:hypothetical protein
VGAALNSIKVANIAGVKLSSVGLVGVQVQFQLEIRMHPHGYISKYQLPAAVTSDPHDVTVLQPEFFSVLW